MNSKVVMYSDESRSKILQGVDKISNVVKVTLGPKGRNVILNNPLTGVPIITKDGVSVAREIKFKDPFEDAGAQLIKEVAQKTADVAGDGTTTATVLAQSIFTEGLKKGIANGANPMFLKRGIDLATSTAVHAIRSISSAVSKDGIHDVAVISANNDQEIGTLISDAVSAAGKDGVITVEESKTMQSKIDIVEGLEIGKGYVSAYFINKIDKMTCEYTDCYVLVTDQKISDMKSVLPILQKTAESGKPILIIADDIEGPALATIIMNTAKGVLKSCVVKAPLYGEHRERLLEDIAIVTGGTFISEKMGKSIKDVLLADLGVALKVVVSKDSCIIIDGQGKKDAIDTRVNVIKSQIEASSNSSFELEKLQERLAKLSGGIVVISIGAITETEMKEKKARVEDALHATRAAVEEGIVPGGGIVYIRAMDEVQKLLKNDYHDDIKMGIKIILSALRSPLQQICKNAGVASEIVLNKILNESSSIETPAFYGYDALNDVYGNLNEMGIIDPTKVTVSALFNAASVAGLLLTTEAIVCDDVEEINEMKKFNTQPGSYPGYAGM